MNKWGVLVCVIVTAGCPAMMPHSSSHPTAATPAKPAAPVVASEDSGSRVVTLYNAGHRELAAGDDAVTAKDEAGASWHYVAAKKDATDAKAFVSEHKSSGQWRGGLHYKTKFDDAELTEDQMLAALDKLATDAGAKWDAFKPKAHKAWKKTYSASTDDAYAKLEELGKPDHIKADKKGTCWYFELDDSSQMWCWSKSGKAAAHKIDQKQVAAAPAGDSGGTTTAPAGPTSVSFDFENKCDKNVRVFYGDGKPPFGSGTNTSINDGTHESLNLPVGNQVWIVDDSEHGVMGVTVAADTHQITIDSSCAQITAN